MSLEATLPSAPGIRPVPLGPREVAFDTAGDGTILLRSPHPLAPIPTS